MLITLLVVILISCFLYLQNTVTTYNNYTVQDEKIPQAFDGYKILQISDFHNTKCLLEKVSSMSNLAKPDIIVITGDLFDCRKTDVETGITLLNELTKITDVYYVYGNHEVKLENFVEVEGLIKQTNVVLLKYEKITLSKNNQEITLIGANDPRSFAKDEITAKDKIKFFEKLMANINDDNYKILLSHRPELFDFYMQAGVNLVLTGHAHGGQFRIPFINKGVLVPDQGFLPEYSEGMHTKNDTTMIISRGIGNSVFPFRLFNTPELVIVTLKTV